MAITKLPPSPRPVLHHKADADDLGDDEDTLVIHKEQARSLPVDDCPKEPQSQLPRRVVCFNESANVQHHNTRWTKADTACLWYTKSQLQHFKTQYRDLCRQISQREAAMANRCKHCWGNVLWRVYDGMADEVDLLVLQTRMGQAHGRIGMEWHATPGLAKERAWQRQQLQQQQQQQQDASLASTCRAVSQPSVRMAHVLALVLQERVLQKDQQDSTRTFAP